MPRRGAHYERAFESCLQQRQIPYVAVDQAKKAVFAGAKIKSFDFILYPRQGPKILADVKGRKVASRSFLRGRGAETWTSRDDVAGLQAWEQVFGSEYLAAFIFAYWLTDNLPNQYEFEASPAANPPQNLIPPSAPYQNYKTNPFSMEYMQPGLFDDVFRFQGRDYSFWVIELCEYRRRMKPRSSKWETVYVPRKSFRESAQPFMEFVLGPQSSKQSYKSCDNK